MAFQTINLKDTVKFPDQPYYLNLPEGKKPYLKQGSQFIPIVGDVNRFGEIKEFPTDPQTIIVNAGTIRPPDFAISAPEEVSSAERRYQNALGEVRPISQQQTQVSVVPPSANLVTSAVKQEDYQLKTGETIEQYNQRIANLRQNVLHEANKIALGNETKPLTVQEQFRQGLDNLFPNQTVTSPSRPSAQASFEALRTQYLSPVQAEYQQAVSDLRSLENQILTQKEKITGTEGVSSRYIQGRLVRLNADNSEALRVAEQKTKDAQDRVTLQQNTVQSLMDAYKWDYTQARDEYEFSFNKALAIQQAMATQANQVSDNARASFTIIQNAIQKNPQAFQEVNDYTRIQWNDIEQKAGFPIGILETMAQAQPNIEIKWTDKGFDAEGREIISFFGLDPTTNQPKLVKVLGTGGVRQPTGEEKLQQGLFEAEEIARKNVSKMTDIEIQNLIRKETGISVTDAKNVVDEVRTEFRSTPEGVKSEILKVFQQYKEANFNKKQMEELWRKQNNWPEKTPIRPEVKEALEEVFGERKKFLGIF